MERRDRLPVLASAAWRCVCLVALASIAPTATAAVYMTQAQALAQAFPGARVERHAFALNEAQARAVESRARARLSSRVLSVYAAWRGDSLVGTAFFDARTVRTMPGVFMVVVAPDSTVGRVDVLAFHEPPDYRPPARWLGLFGRRRLDDGLRPGGDVRNLSGATLSTRAVTECTRLALALYEIVAVPALTDETRSREGR